MITDGLDVAPFRGVRYGPDHIGSLATVTSPPYDVVVRPDGLHELETSDPYNIVRLTLPQGADPASGHRNAARTLERWRDEGVLRQDPEPALYLYEQRGPARPAAPPALQRGIIGALRLSDPAEGVVLPHEDVMPSVVAERADLMRKTSANLEPLLLTYRGGGTAEGATALLERITASRAALVEATTDDGFTHRLWSVTDPLTQQGITTDLARHTALIGDGHHRWATCLRLAREHGGAPPWDRGLVLLVDTDRYPLRVQAIHRVLPHLVPEQALELLSAQGAFRVRALGGSLTGALDRLERTTGNAFVLAHGAGPPESSARYHLLDRPDRDLLERTVPTDRPASWRRLDASVLHSALLDAVWRVPDAPGAIQYLHDPAAAVAQARRTHGTAVLMRAVTERTVRELAERGVTMPRKSTSFGPKPATGLVLRTLR